MSVVILKLNDGYFTINGKEIYKDTNGNWIAREELTTAELKEFRGYKERAID